jgi:hypothetical protein
MEVEIDYVGLVKGMGDDRKQAEHFILNYEQERLDYEKKKLEYLEAKKEPAAAGKGNLPGKPVEAQAVKSADYDMESIRYWWLRAVETAMRTFGERKHIFISVRREAERQGNYREGQPGRRAWVVYTQRRYAEEIQKRFINAHGWMGERTIRAWWAQILDCIVEIHLRIAKK